MFRHVTALVGATVFACVSASAQTAATAPVVAPAAVVLAPASDGVVRAGTPIALKMSEGLKTDGKQLKAGYRFQMEVAEPVLAGTAVVIPAGTPVTGEVTEVKNTGMWGKAGAIQARVLFARLNGRQVRMTGVFDDKGKSGTVGVVAAVALLPAAGFFVKGKNASIPIGTTIGGFLDEDLAFVPVAGSPAVAPVMPTLTPVSAVSPK